MKSLSKQIQTWLEQTDEENRLRPIRVELWDEVGRMDYGLIFKTPVSVYMTFTRASNEWKLKIVWNNGNVTVPSQMKMFGFEHPAEIGHKIKVDIE